MSTRADPRHAVRRRSRPRQSGRRRVVTVTALCTVGAVLSAVLLLHVGFVTGRVSGWVTGTPDAMGLRQLGMSGTNASDQQHGRTPARWNAVLRRLDDRRDEAWQAGAPTVLSRVFVVGSRPWYADRAALRGYLTRGYTVTGARMRFWHAHVVSRTTGAVRLRVVDRLTPVTVRSPAGTPTPLPHDRRTRHVITLRQSPVGWRITAIRPG